MNTSNAQQIESAGAATAPTMERRRATREACSAPAWVSAEAGTRGTNFQVKVVDLSLNGIGFQAEINFQTGSVHWVVLGGSGLRASSRIRIVSSRERLDGEY